MSELEVEDPELLRAFQQLRHSHEQLSREKRQVEALCSELESDADQKQQAIELLKERNQNLAKNAAVLKRQASLSEQVLSQLATTQMSPRRGTGTGGGIAKASDLVGSSGASADGVLDAASATLGLADDAAAALAQHEELCSRIARLERDLSAEREAATKATTEIDALRDALDEAIVRAEDAEALLQSNSGKFGSADGEEALGSVMATDSTVAAERRALSSKLAAMESERLELMDLLEEAREEAREAKLEAAHLQAQVDGGGGGEESLGETSFDAERKTRPGAGLSSDETKAMIKERLELRLETYEQRDLILDLKLEMARLQWEMQSVAQYCSDRDQTIFRLLSKKLSKKARLSAMEVLKATSLDL